MDKFGRRLRPLWHLDPGGTFLNHGSFGACPKRVLSAQSAWREVMEQQPDEFFRKRVFPQSSDNAVRAAAETLARFVGTTGEHIAFVVNATEAVNTVLRSLDLAAGDEVLVLDCVYNAVRLAAEEVCHPKGAKVVKVALPLPLAVNDVVERIADAANERTKLAIIDHISSPSAMLFPVAEITRALHAKGVKVLIDGAHAVGQLALDLPVIGADWYTANAHKWLYAPKGSAFLYAHDEAAARVRPLSVSHYHDLAFPHVFDYVGTRDVTAFLSVPSAIAFFDEFGAEDVRRHLLDQSRQGAEIVKPLGVTPVAPDAMFAAMRAFILPQRRAVEAGDVVLLMRGLWDKHRIQVAANAFQNKFILRLSPQIYVERADFEHVAQVLERDGWPGR